MGARLRVGGAEYEFRAPNRAEAAALVEAGSDLDAVLAALRPLAVDPSGYDALVAAYPMAAPRARPALLERHQADARDRVRRAVRLWKASERSPGHMAENLLALWGKSDWEDPRVFAGALTVAEWVGATKGIFQLVLALLKGLARKR